MRMFWAKYGKKVALRKESVDRNNTLAAELLKMGSLSARRAWIEMAPARRRASSRSVALRKESVDRNFGIETN